MQGNIYPDNFETTIHFDKIKSLLSSYCVNDIGKEKVDQLSFLTHFFEIKKTLLYVDEFKKILIEKLNFPTLTFSDERELLAQIKSGDSFHQSEELLRIRHTIEKVTDVLLFFKKHKDTKFPHLCELTTTVSVYPFVKEKIDKLITPKGRLKDSASRKLNRIRKALMEKENFVSKRIQQIYKRTIKEGWVKEDMGVSVCNGRLVIPVPVTHKRKLEGIVHDESSSGKTTFIEPIEIVELNNEIHNLENEERKEIIFILQQFSQDVRPYIDDLIQYFHFLGIIDFIRAKAQLAVVLNALLPELKNEPIFNWKKAVHPLLYLTHKKENKQVVRQNIQLDSQQRIMLISGPNTGGKSVCLQMIGLLQYMLQCGLLVPVDENSIFGLVDQIFIDMGDEQNIENDLSTYSSHLLNMKYFLKNANENTLILIDEFGVGTEPVLGGAIAESILQGLNNLQTFGIVTTHYGNLKYLASNTKGIINAAMLFDTKKMKPLFQLRLGIPGSSFAFEVAHKIGLPDEILIKAKTKVGKKQLSFDKYLREILRDKQYIESKRKDIRRKERKLEKLTDEYEVEILQFEKERKKLLLKARKDSETMLKNANKTIENTIRIIKETNAEKEKTRRARKQLESFKEKLKIDPSVIDNRLKKIKTVHKQDSSRKIRPKKFFISTTLSVGDYAILSSHGKKVKILKIKKNEALVAFGNMSMNVRLKDLSRINYSGKENEPGSNYRNISTIQTDVYNKRLHFNPDIDVRGLHSEEALHKVMHHIDDALMLGFEKIKILHGTGYGILRKVIRDYLMSRSDIAHFGDEDIQFGGSGITRVALHPD